MIVDPHSFQQATKPKNTAGCSSLESDCAVLVQHVISEMKLTSVVDASDDNGEFFTAFRHLPFPCIDVGNEVGKSFQQRRSGEQSYLTTSLNTLHSLERDRISHALWDLRQICDDFLLLMVSTCPSRQYNKYHPTVISRRTWVRLASALGFEEVELKSLPADGKNEDKSQDWAIEHWKTLNPFREENIEAPQFILLRKRDSTVRFEEFDANARTLLGVDSASSLNIPENTNFNFLLGHYQEFLLFQPFFDRLPQERVRVLIRSGIYQTLDDNRFNSIVSFLESKRISIEYLTKIDELKWETSAQTRNTLITAIDSTAGRSHLINSCIVENARAAGCPTFQLQHGIWPKAEYPEQNTVLCDHLLAWSEDYRKPFDLDTDRESLDTTPRHSFHRIGCPRFDCYADAKSVPIEDLLGDWAKKYKHSVVIATNLHWPLHSLGSDVLPQLFTTAREMPDTLFICKLHPVHNFDQVAFADMPSNVLVVDEFVSLYANLSTPRLIKACDAVVCTLSTVALESALAKKPFVILETGNPNHYEGTAEVPIVALTSAVKALLSDSQMEDANREFLDCYYTNSKHGNALSSTIDVIKKALNSPKRQSSGIDLAVRTLSQEFLRLVEANQTVEVSTTQSCDDPKLPDSCDNSNQLELCENMETNTPTERWRYLRKYLRSIQKRMPKLRSLEAKIPSSERQISSRDECKAIDRKNKTNNVTLKGVKSRNDFPQLLRELGLNGLGIELGVAAGDYSDYLLENSDLRVLFSVDRWSDHHDDEEARFTHTRLSRFGVRSSVLKMTFDEASDLFADSTFDFIFLDGYAHLGQDGDNTLFTWWRKLRSNGIFAGHDYHPAWPKTVEVVDRFANTLDLELFTTEEDPQIVEHAYPSWYVCKP